MAIRRRPRPTLEEREYSTYWPADDAIDQSGSSLDQYCMTRGDPVTLKIREGQVPAEIVYRPLTERELLAVGMAGHHAPFEACRYGLVSIEGIDLARISYPNGLRGLTQASLDELSDEIVMDLPWVLTIDLLNETAGAPPKQRKDAPYEAVSLSRLIGHFIQVVTFCQRRRSDSA